jgi:predicted S18 family serine protease
MAKKNQNGKTMVALFLVVLAVSALLGTYSIFTINSLNNKVATLTNSINTNSELYSAPAETIPGTSAPSQSTSSEVTIPIVAVSSSTNKGVVDSLTVKVEPGDEGVLVHISPFLAPDLQSSANQAVTIAKSETGLGSNDNFIFDFQDSDAKLIGGGSAGSSMTLATIAALENKQIRTDTVMTGTIKSDGTIGPIGGILEKAQAVSEAGYKNFLIPQGQGTITIYEPHLVRQNMGFGMMMQRVQYTTKTVNVIQYAKDNWGLNVIEVANIDDAMKYFLK